MTVHLALKSSMKLIVNYINHQYFSTPSFNSYWQVSILQRKKTVAKNWIKINMSVYI